MTASTHLSEATLPSWDYIRSRFVEDGVPGIIVLRDTPRVAFFVDADRWRFGGYFETNDPAALTPLATVRCVSLQLDDRRCLEFSVAEPSLFRSFYQFLSDLAARVLDGASVGTAALSAVSALETDSGFSGREDFWIIAAIQERR